MTISDLQDRGFTAVQIPLTQGYWTTVDLQDIDFASGRWCLSRCGEKLYASCTRNRKQLRMHRMIAGAEFGDIVDHRSGDSLDNRRSNLRICTIADNARARGLNRNRPGKFKGVHFRSDRRKFYVRIANKHLGYFDSAEDAANAYNRAAKEMFGDFAVLNKIAVSNTQGSAPTVPQGQGN